MALKKTRKQTKIFLTVNGRPAIWKSETGLVR